MIENVVQFWCETDAEYNDAKMIQAQHDEMDPKHETLPRVVVIDCRTKY